VHVDFLHPEVELSTDADGRVHLDGAFDLTATLAPWGGETEAELWLDKLDVTTPDTPRAPVVGEIRVPEGASMFPLVVEGESGSTVRVPFTGTSLETPGDELAWLCSIGRPMELQGAVYDAETGSFQSFYDAASQLQGPAHEITFSRKDSASRPLPLRFASIVPQGMGGFLDLEVEHAWGGLVLGGSLLASLNLGDRQILADGAGDAVLVRFDAQGNVLWDHTFGNVGAEGISSLSQRDGAISSWEGITTTRSISGPACSRTRPADTVISSSACRTRDRPCGASGSSRTWRLRVPFVPRQTRASRPARTAV